MCLPPEFTASTVQSPPVRAARRRGRIARCLSAALGAVVVLVTGSGCGDRGWETAAARNTGGDPREGRIKIQSIGCGACHSIPGIVGARSSVGPSLRGFVNRHYIGGVLTNTPDHLVQWLLDPRAHSPKTAMPALGLSEKDARNIAAYLYTLRD